MSVQLIQKNQFEAASKAMPTKIEGTFDEPKVREVILAIGEDSVVFQVRFELVQLAALMSVGGNLNDAQSKFIAKQLVDMFPNETLADFKLCFQRGAIGLYGDIQRMDGITIGGWMKLYLDEKYQVLEDKMMREKDSHPYQLSSAEKVAHAPIKDGMPAPPEVAQKYIDELKENFKSTKKEIGLTKEEIKELGKEDPPMRKSTSYMSSWYNVRGIKVQAHSPEHAEEIVRMAIKRGEIEEVQE